MSRRMAFLILVIGALVAAGVGGGVLARGPHGPLPAHARFGISGDCTRTFDTLDQETTERIGVNTNDMSPSVTVTYALSVESGSASITFDTISTGTVSKTATPGSPVAGKVRVTLDAFNQLKFRLAPNDGNATGVSYEIHFDCECVP